MKKKNIVQGVYAVAPRPTRAVAVLVAVGVSVPVFLGLMLVEWMFF